MLQGRAAFEFERSWQLISCIGSNITRHEAKQEAKENGVKDWHTMGQSIGIFKVSTMEDYQRVAYQAIVWIKEKYSEVRGPKDIDANHVSAFLEYKICDCGLARSSIRTYAAALEKWSCGLEKLSGQTYDWSSRISEMRHLAKAVCGDQTERRSFYNPEAVLSAITREGHKYYADVQYRCGIRIDEVRTIQIDNQGRVFVTGKGSYTREIFPNSSMRAEMVDRIKFLGTVGLETKSEQDSYRKSLQRACKSVGEKYSGSHSWRHNAAQEFFDIKIASGFSYRESLRLTSEFLGHHRENVVEKFYLKR